MLAGVGQNVGHKGRQKDVRQEDSRMSDTRKTLECWTGRRQNIGWKRTEYWTVNGKSSIQESRI